MGARVKRPARAERAVASAVSSHLIVPVARLVAICMTLYRAGEVCPRCAARVAVALLREPAP